MSDVGNLTVKLALDNSNFQQGMQNLNRSMRKAQVDFRNATTGTDGLGKGLNNLQAKSTMLTKQVDIQSKILKANKERFDSSKESLDKNVRAQEELKQQLGNTRMALEQSKKSTGENSEETKRLEKQLGELTAKAQDNEEKIRNNVKTMENWEMKTVNAETKLKSLEGSLSSTNKEIEKQQSKWYGYSKTLGEVETKVSNTSKKMGEMGSSLNRKLTLPIMGAGGYAIKTVQDLQKELGTLSTMIPGQSKRLQELKNDIQDVSINVGKHTTEITRGAYDVISAYGDSADTMEKVKLNAMGATAGVAETSDALNLTSAVMKGFGDTSAEANKKVLDLSFETLKLGQTSFPDLASSIGKVVPQTNELKISQEELFAVFATGTGVTGNASEVSTQYQGVLKALMAPTKDMTKLMKQLGVENGNAMIEQYGLIGSIEEIVKSSKKTKQPLQKYIGSIQGQTLALALAGEQSDVFKEKLEKLKKSSGAMETAFNEHTQGVNKAGFTYEQAMARMRVSAQEFGEAMGPTIGYGAELLENLTTKVKSLDQEQKEMIINVGGMLALAGPVLTIGGKLGGMLGSGIGLTRKLSENILEAGGATQLLGTAFSSLTSPIGLTIGALGLVGGALYAYNQKMSETSIEIQGFGDIVSETTASAMDDFMELEREASNSLRTMTMSNKEVTQEMAEDVSTNFQTMTDSIKEHMETRRSEEIETLDEIFSKNEFMTAENRDNILEIIEGKYEEEVIKHEEGNQKIQEILKTAAAENRKLTEQEENQILDIKQRMQNRAVKVIAEGSIEQKALFARLREDRKINSAEEASDLVKESIKRKDAVLKVNKEEYEKSLGYAVLLREKGTEEANKLADEVEIAAKKQYNHTMNDAHKTHNEIMRKAKEHSGEYIDHLDWETGEILNVRDIRAKKMIKEAENEKKALENQQKARDKFREEQNKKTMKIVQDNIKENQKNGENTIVSFLKGLVRKRPELEKETTKTTKNIDREFNKLPKEMNTIGSDVMSGFNQGMLAKRPAVMNTATQTVNMVLSEMRRGFDTHSPSRKTIQIAKDVNEGLIVGSKQSSDKVLKEAKDLANNTIKELEKEFKEGPSMTVPISTLQGQTKNALNKKSIKGYEQFASQLKADELEETKKILDKEYKIRETALNKQIRNLDKKKNKSRIDSLNKEKETLRETNTALKEILDERLDIAKESIKKESNIFEDRMTQYDESIKRLSIKNDDLSESLVNQNAIYMLQAERIKELNNQHIKISKQFGETSDEAIKLRKELEKSKTEYIKYGETIKEVEESIIKERIANVDGLHSSLISALKKSYDEQYKLQTESINKEIKSINEWKDYNNKAINEVYNNKIKKIDEATNKQIEAIKKELQLMDSTEKAKTREEEKLEKEEAIRKLKESIEYEHNEFNKAELEKKLNEETNSLKELLNKWEVEDKKESLNQQIIDIQNQANKEKEIAREQYESEINRIDTIYTYETERLNHSLERQRQHYEKVTQEAYLQAEAEKMILDNKQKDILKMLETYEPGYFKAGQSLGQKMLDGFEEGFKQIEKMIDQINQAAGLMNSNISATRYNVPNASTTNNSSNVVNNNQVVFNSPREMNYREQQRQTETTLRKLAWS